MRKRQMVSVDGDQIELMQKIQRNDLKRYDKTKRIRIALQEWLKDNAQHIKGIYYNLARTFSYYLGGLNANNQMS